MNKRTYSPKLRAATMKDKRTKRNRTRQQKKHQLRKENQDAG